MIQRSSSLLLLITVLVIGGGVAVFAATWADDAANKTNANAVSQSDANNADSNDTVLTEDRTTHTNSEFGFQLQHPSAWSMTADNSGTGEFAITNYVFSDGTVGVTLTVVPASLEGIIRESVSVTSEESLTVGGVPAEKLVGKQAKDGSNIALIIFKNSDTVFSFSGTPQLVSEIAQTFQFVP